MSGLVADCTETGWLRYIRLEPDGSLGPKHQLLEYSDRWAFRHLCDRGPRGIIICAPRLDLHTITVDDEGYVTVTPSILCADCMTHGHITRNVWTSC